ncbi:MAG: sugar phosphate nucleotidyltransferase [candidate division KSB1 bacterium]|nr:sugar phosphate nucleotidyltransferase [candidate division KSB1 bacterium]
MKKVLAMILAGGRVDELSVLTIYRPKSAVPFGGMYRVIDFPLSNLMHSGIEKVGILSQYRSTSLINQIKHGEPWDFTGRNRGTFLLPPSRGYRASDWYKGPADAVYQNLEFIQEQEPELVLILSGDHIYKMDYQPLIEFHQRMGAELTVVFKQVKMEEASRFGLAEIDDTGGEQGGRITNYQEKPEKPTSNWASLTIYLFNPPVLEEVLRENRKLRKTYEFGRDIIPRMIGKYQVYGYKFYGYWGYTRTIEEYWQTNMDLLGDSPKIDLEAWEIRTNLEHRGIRDRVPTQIGPQAQITDSLIYNGCRIEGNIIHSILFPGVQVEKGAEVRDSIIMFDTVIQQAAILDKVIVDTDGQIGAGCYLGYGDDFTPNKEQKSLSSGITVVGRWAVIPPEVKIGRNCVIYPRCRKEHFKKKLIKSGETVR